MESCDVSYANPAIENGVAFASTVVEPPARAKKYPFVSLLM